jgi:flagellar assembly protein FliH
MYTFRNIIKSDAAQVLGSSDPQPSERLLRRVPRTRIAIAPVEPEEETPYRLTGVVRRNEAALLAEVFELPVLEPAPAFPLAAPEPEPEEPVEPPPPPPPVDPDALKAEWDAAWEARMAEAVERARQEGREAGRAEAEEALRAEVEAAKAAFLEDAARLRDAWRAFMEKTEPMLAHLAFTTARAILDAPLPSDVKDFAARTLSRAVDRLAGEAPLRISLHPVDLLRLRESGLADELSAAHPGLEWDSDERLKEGDWIVQSPAAMIRHVKEELLDTLHARLGLPPLDD